MLGVLAALALGYLLGGVATAAWLARLQGKDIFRLGSGNMGTMNTAGQLGWQWGLLVLLIDLGKGALASYAGLLMAQLAGAEGVAGLALPLAASLGAVLGHAYSPYVGFRGGKALATALGTTLPLYPLLGAYSLGILLALLLIVRRVAWASVLTMAAAPVVAELLLRQQLWPREQRFAAVTAVLAIVLVVISKHIPDLRRGEKPLF